MKIFRVLWSRILTLARYRAGAPRVRCETCPRWRRHVSVQYTLPTWGNVAQPRTEPVRIPDRVQKQVMGICAIAAPAIINQGGIGYGIRLFGVEDWCPLHPLHTGNLPGVALRYRPPVTFRMGEGGQLTGEPYAGFDRPPSLAEAMEIARQAGVPVADLEEGGKAFNIPDSIRKKQG